MQFNDRRAKPTTADAKEDEHSGKFSRRGHKGHVKQVAATVHHGRHKKITGP